MADQVHATDLPVGSVVELDGKIWKKKDNRIDGTHWIAAMMWSGDAVYDPMMDQMLRDGVVQVLRVGADRPVLPEVRPGARERLARHLLVTSVDPALRTSVGASWDDGTLVGGARAEFLAQADAVLVLVVNGRG